MARKHHECV